MKRSLLTVSLVLLLAGLAAASVTRTQAADVAAYKLQVDGQTGFTLGNTEIIGDNLAWVFHLNPQGFVVVTSDTNLPPVIFYSYIHEFSTEDVPLNIGLQMLRDDLQLRLAAVSQTDVTVLERNNANWQAYLDHNAAWFNTRSRSVYPATGSTPTGGWVLSNWNQNPSPYWDMCPTSPSSGQRCVVGCVATALAQIVNYHRHIGNVTFSDSDDYWSGYTPPFIHIDDDAASYNFPTFTELNAEMDELRAIYATDDAIDNDGIAALSYACGVVVDMNYDPDGSGAYTQDARNALLYRFNFSSASYHSYNSNFFGYLEEDMINARPAEMGITSSTGGDGHAIVVDGWNSGDDTYHLNMGWGGSSDGWYSLPSGMPSGFDIINGAVTGIEGGDVPLTVTGNVQMSGGSPIGTIITLVNQGDVPWTYESIVVNTDGSFDVSAVFPGEYLATATLGNRFWYAQQLVSLDENNTHIQFNMGNYTAITGNVTGPVAVEGTRVVIYNEDGTVATSGEADASGAFSLPPLYPGNYHATASQSGNYFAAEDFTVTADNQSVDFSLENLAGDLSYSYAGAPTQQFSLAANLNLTCAIKLTGEELAGLAGSALAKVRFKAPLGSDQAQYWGQIWNGNMLVSEVSLPEVTADEWTEAVLPVFAEIDTDDVYYLGYRMISSTGAYAWRDAGPHVAGRGGFYRTGSWVELTSANNFNFCIEAVAITNHCGTVSGAVGLSGGNGTVSDTAVRSGVFGTHPDADGHYTLLVVPGTVDLTAALNDYTSGNISGVSVGEGETVSAQNFTLTYTGGAEQDDTAVWDGKVSAYPNPFNPSTTFRFELPSASPVLFTLYDVRGRRVRTLVDQNLPAGEHFVSWDGLDDAGRPVASGVYLFRVKSGIFTPAGKVILLK